MFHLLRRRRTTSVPATTSRSTAPEQAAAQETVVNAELLVRVARLRAALLAAGLDLDEHSTPEPAWFSILRSGDTISLDALQQRELTEHLAGIAAAHALDDAACAHALDKIEALVVLSEMRAEGIVPGCSPTSIIKQTSAADLRMMAALVRQAEEERHGAPPAAPSGA
ncbi:MULTISPECIES: hypothetical protein [Streptomyces]|uniref:hypothetical protein n=1 Tax=Streptomyces TaxID=1883 RepID=UPI00225BDAED|nr:MULTISPECIES: hypothetical protein [Streptomyces]MCX5278112.1 hypothetical protein [Streptomyces virginiae]